MSALLWKNEMGSASHGVPFSSHNWQMAENGPGWEAKAAGLSWKASGFENWSFLDGSCRSSAVFFLAGQHCCLEFCVRKGLQGLLLLTGIFYQIDLGFWEKRKFCEGAFRALSDLKFHWHADIAFLWCVKIELGGGRGGVMGALVGRTGYLRGRVSTGLFFFGVSPKTQGRKNSRNL